MVAYRPYKPTSAGALTVYAQHQAYFDQNNNDQFPREAFIQDLIMEVEKWKKQGDQWVITVDANEDIRLGGV